MSEDWPTGPEAVRRLAAWCATHGVTLGRLGARCTPVVHRSTFQRWRAGREPSRVVWLRLVDRMAAMETEQLQRMLEG